MCDCGFQIIRVHCGQDRPKDLSLCDIHFGCDLVKYSWAQVKAIWRVLDDDFPAVNEETGAFTDNKAITVGIKGSGSTLRVIISSGYSSEGVEGRDTYGVDY